MCSSKQEFLEDLILTKHMMIESGQVSQEVLAGYVESCDKVIRMVCSDIHLETQEEKNRVGAN